MENTRATEMEAKQENPGLKPVTVSKQTNGAMHMTGAHKPIASDTKQMQSAYPFDQLTHAWISKAAAGLSPISLSMAFYDWAAHLSLYPEKRMELARDAFQKAMVFSTHFAHVIGDEKNETEEPVITPQARDYRFRDKKWQKWPYNSYYQSFLLLEEWWNKSTSDIRGVSRHHLDVVNFFMRQVMDIFSPSNLPWMNPEIVSKTIEEGGQNIVRGFQNVLEDISKYASGTPSAEASQFRPGKEVAVTPGKVVYRNTLMELIEYSPATDQVHPEPVLIIPAWIMKYYILDLSPRNSLVKYLVDQGHTVFMISWKNPDAQDRDLGLEDYLRSGVLDALDAIEAIVPDTKIHATGYCLGGTLLAIAAAYLARQKKDILKTITFFAAQVDFEEAGELMLFVDESQLAVLEDIMWQQGYLDKSQMAGAFSMLRSNDLIWSRMIHDYLMGERNQLNDLMSWNADATRLPFKMHSEYLRKLYLNNELTGGHFQIAGKSIALTDINAPVFAVGTVKDHVAPWRSVYKMSLFMDTDVTFVLTTGGHNAGIVSDIDHPGRSYQLCCSRCGESNSYIPPDTWTETAPPHEGSWWPAWQKWLAGHSSAKTTPPPMGKKNSDYQVLYDAPGQYVLQK